MKEEKKQSETSSPEQTLEKGQGSEEKDIKDNKGWALLSYLGVLVVVPLIAKTDSPFVQFHTKQGLVILAGWVLTWFPFGFVFGIIAIVLSALGFVSALNGEKRKLPIVGDLAEKINL